MSLCWHKLPGRVNALRYSWANKHYTQQSIEALCISQVPAYSSANPVLSSIPLYRERKSVRGPDRQRSLQSFLPGAFSQRRQGKQCLFISQVRQNATAFIGWASIQIWIQTYENTFLHLHLTDNVYMWMSAICTRPSALSACSAVLTGVCGSLLFIPLRGLESE